MEKKELCPLCFGTNFSDTGAIEKLIDGRKTLQPYAIPCPCYVNKSICSRFEILHNLPAANTEDSDKIHSRYDIAENKKIGEGNFLFFGDESAFLYIVKCYFLKDFSLKNFMLLEGGAIVEKYHVPQKDGTWLTVVNLSIYDLLIILFTTNNGYETLKNCVIEVIKNRMRLGKPTWIYVREELKLPECREYSKDLDHFLENFKRINVNQSFDYKGYDKKVSEKEKIQDRRDKNDQLANY